MKFLVSLSSFAEKTDCFIIGVFEGNKLTSEAKKLDQRTQLYISNLLKKQGDFQAKVGQSQLLYTLPNLGSSRVLLIGCGPGPTLSVRDFRKIIYTSTKALCSANITAVVNYLNLLPVETRSLSWKIKQTIEVSRDSLYQFDQFKSTRENKALKEMTLTVENKSQLTSGTDALEQGTAIADGMELTKNLGNMPSNICTPTYLAEQAKILTKTFKTISIKTLDKNAIKKLGMGAFASVTQGSAQDAKLICLTYKGGAKKQQPIVLVGKGVTFDTGGINSKSADGMVGMKYDMCGAATILGVMQTIAKLKLPLHVVGLLACTENMPSGAASKPEDIVRTLSGQTVEIMNTDAEGRLILCDTLTYAERYDPAVVIDIATLTGAVVVALGYHASAVLSNHEPLAQDLLAAGIESHDRVWQMPLWDEYQDQIKSPFADMANTGGRTAGVITSSCFLSRFAKKFKWAHLDVAGTAAMMGGTADRSATGRPVPLLVQYLLNQCK